MGAKWSSYIGKISMSVTTMVWVRMPSRDWNIDAQKKNHDPIPLQSNLGCAVIYALLLAVLSRVTIIKNM